MGILMKCQECPHLVKGNSNSTCIYWGVDLKYFDGLGCFVDPNKIKK